MAVSIEATAVTSYIGRTMTSSHSGATLRNRQNSILRLKCASPVAIRAKSWMIHLSYSHRSNAMLLSLLSQLTASNGVILQLEFLRAEILNDEDLQQFTIIPAYKSKSEPLAVLCCWMPPAPPNLSVSPLDSLHTLSVSSPANLTAAPPTLA